ncbi:ABC transporter-like protein [Leptolyngbya boryana NIES-2135]|jgi:lipopolysaccharide transport system ATP-binding protein|uniref:ABC transporter-like protein n=1 Tax=Leptolyngbya boryana NIES-2135 TaxID=1973484 RepID=A0A1Z4JBF7_LEPBY|nr:MULTISPECIES: ABC transporter ATP-binding protein [Leptolyngbya]BAY54104.1 ABC transporter-like protein [Leptolyngbya boryana NIES-2135]MBD2369760.1 ABC transporter ATP-binding protein [Leptolyngbya sp. FACHB-161]MBD2376039.1 ABC transporter ATP-binding protein [Leptolyngbya sp. FACHB-238]MBD2400315.1 ABC transporter ATP-binding protein [Leptolyngbya sp. FACHB-239]MBD2406856.1 ABC transporter ATP-binding protein [Leptolyngbya sp. FACHB-402]
MSDTVIQVKNLGKKYIIGHKQQRDNTLRDALTHGFKSFGKRLQHPASSGSREEFWALDDVSFEIRQGDRVGIIGRNGAGKSTLLKVLSRITEPSRGKIVIDGRIASLLEVGTGFHGELTGRENIYLNGAILGMSKAEIGRKFDEIVAFSEVEKFLDTPVKRYSSGMYVRLAFAVAAHLEPEILIVDEVLAVGDAAFQKKCLGKMEDVSTREGRTVLFVSHSMGTVQQLCNHCILLQKGQVTDVGAPERVIGNYLKSNSVGVQKDIVRKGNKKVVFDDFYISNDEGIPCSTFLMGDTISVFFSLRFNTPVENPVIGIQITNPLNETFAHVVNLDDGFEIQPNGDQRVKVKVDIPNVFFAPSQYYFSFWIGENFSICCDELIDCIAIELLQGNRLKRLMPFPPHVKTFLNTRWSEVND